MNNYCLVENGKITTGPKPLPKNWKHVRGLNLDLENAKNLGWLPVTVTEPTFDEATQKKGDRVDIIEADSVSITWNVVALTQEEIQQNINNTAKQAIRELEALQTPRRMAEAAADSAGGTTAGRTWLKENRVKIQVERDKIVE
ncbi:MAG: hypothetical protein HQL68_02250 [Magnetococcales bacterium]|nr:hypothetical protein [Magnetococcales bacterium]